MGVMNMKNIEYHQKYFRPSRLPALNLGLLTSEFFNPFYGKTYNEIQLPAELTKTPEDTILNYFRILLEAGNLLGRSCGSVGQGHMPFPIAYNFLSKEYQEKVSYEEYVQTFAGVGHTSLIKLSKIATEKQAIRFFYEIETIVGSIDVTAEYFGYSYGFMEIIYEHSGYRINTNQQIREDFLCAPYHLWEHDAEAAIDIKYGEWCKLIKKRYPTIKKDYVKYIYFQGTDEADYCIIFFTLTNGTDIEIIQYRKESNEDWKQVKLVPEKDCLQEP